MKKIICQKAYFLASSGSLAREAVKTACQSRGQVNQVLLPAFSCGARQKQAGKSQSALGNASPQFFPLASCRNPDMTACAAAQAPAKSRLAKKA